MGVPQDPLGAEKTESSNQRISSTRTCRSGTCSILEQGLGTHAVTPVPLFFDCRVQHEAEVCPYCSVCHLTLLWTPNGGVDIYIKGSHMSAQMPICSVRLYVSGEGRGVWVYVQWCEILCMCIWVCYHHYVYASIHQSNRGPDLAAGDVQNRLPPDCFLAFQQVGRSNPFTLLCCQAPGCHLIWRA
jgi:hypothetical protein